MRSERGGDGEPDGSRSSRSCFSRAPSGCPSARRGRDLQNSHRRSAKPTRRSRRTPPPMSCPTPITSRSSRRSPRRRSRRPRCRHRRGRACRPSRDGSRSGSIDCCGAGRMLQERRQRSLPSGAAGSSQPAGEPRARPRERRGCSSVAIRHANRAGPGSVRADPVVRGVPFQRRRADARAAGHSARAAARECIARLRSRGVRERGPRPSRRPVRTSAPARATRCGDGGAISCADSQG